MDRPQRRVVINRPKKIGRHVVHDLIGQKFGRLTVVEFVRTDVHILGVKKIRVYHDMWRCKCVCGAYWITRAHSLLTGGCRSCGCLRVELAKKNGGRFARMVAAFNRSLWGNRDPAKAAHKELESDPEFLAAVRAASRHKPADSK